MYIYIYICLYVCIGCIKGKHFYFTTVTAKLEACMLTVDLSELPPAKLVPTYTAR